MMHKNHDRLENVSGKDLQSSIWNESDYIWGMIVKTSYDEDIEVISLSSDLMFRYDKYSLESSNYTPYFCEFLITEEHNDTKQKLLRDFAGKWKKVFLAKNKADLFSKTNINENNYVVLEGMVLFANSPIIRKTCWLAISQEVEDFRGADKQNKNFLKNYIYKFPTENYSCFNDIFTDIENLKSVSGTVYNVGQGSAMSLNLGNTRLLFDIGESKNPKGNEKTLIENAYKEINTQVWPFIILSHWDLDHIFGVTRLNKSVFKETIWVAPHPKLVENAYFSLSALRLCAFLLSRQRIHLIDNKNNFNHVVTENQDGSFKLWQGSCTYTKNGIRNNIGLIIELCINNSPQYETHLLFTGDCAYKKMPISIFTKTYDLVVVPHHGSKEAISRNRNVATLPKGKFCSVSGNNGKAIISYGENTYGHPSPECMEDLRAKGFVFLSTRDYGTIVFNLDSQTPLQVRSINHDQP